MTFCLSCQAESRSAGSLYLNTVIFARTCPTDKQHIGSFKRSQLMTEILKCFQCGSWGAFAVPLQSVVNTKLGFRKPLIYCCHTLEQVILPILRVLGTGVEVYCAGTASRSYTADTPTLFVMFNLFKLFWRRKGNIFSVRSCFRLKKSSSCHWPIQCAMAATYKCSRFPGLAAADDESEL